MLIRLMMIQCLLFYSEVIISLILVLYVSMKYDQKKRVFMSQQYNSEADK